MPQTADPMRQWQSGALGRALTGAEATLLAGALDDVFGLELLQLGAWGMDRELLSGCRICRQTLLAGDGLSATGDIRADLARLPVGSGIIDAVLLPHTLELAPDPHAVLREADRVLGGEGQLLVLGFRPLSPWGLRAAARSGYPPGLRRTLSEWRVRDWLVLLGYEVVLQRRYLYRWPVNPRRGEQQAMDSVLRRGWFYPWPASGYLIKARKRLYTLTPVRPRLPRLKLRGTLAEPSA